MAVCKLREPHGVVLVLSLNAMGCSVFESPLGVDAGSENANDGRDEKVISNDGAEDGGFAGNNGSTDPWWPHETEAGCASAGMPTSNDRPALSDPGPELPPIYLAFSHLSEGSAVDDTTSIPETLTLDPNAWQSVGFDFDGRCTNSSTCTNPDEQPLIESACKNDALIPFDGLLCRDNQVGHLYQVGSTAPDLSQLFGFTEEDTNCELKRGGTSAILKISQYNGRLNDAQVRLDMYTSIGLVNQPSWTCRATIDSPIDHGWPSQADWLSTSPWIVAQQSINLAATDAGGELPSAIASDPAAYVRNGYLVSQMPEGSVFWFAGDRTPIRRLRTIMHRGILVAKLTRSQDLTWVVTDGTLAFVGLPQELLKAFREIGFCENMCAQYDVLKNYINVSVDVLSTTSGWFPDTPCDSLTAAFGFRARQATARPGDIRPAIDPVDCPEPLSPKAPRQGCVCMSSGGCSNSDAGAEAGTGDGGVVGGD